MIFKIPKKHYKTGEKQPKTNLGPNFDATLDQVLTQKTQNLDQVLTLQHIYIYTYIYIYIYCSAVQASEDCYAMVDSGTNAIIVPLHPDMCGEIAEGKVPSSIFGKS